MSRAGDVYICEDGDNFEICLITPDRQVATFMRLDPEVHAGTDAAGNESVGVVFDPSGQRMYFGVQRSFMGQGVVYEVSGPFRADTGAPPAGVVAGGTGVGGGAGAGLAPGGEGRLTSADRVAPGVRLRTSRSISVTNLTRRGLAVTFELDEPAGIELKLRSAGGTVIAKRGTPVAVSGRVRMRVKPSAKVARGLRRAQRTRRSTLVITVVDRAGNARVLRRSVTVRPAARRRRVGRR